MIDLLNKKFVGYIFIVLLGYVFFRQDDTAVSYIYSKIDNGAILYGMSTSLACFFSFVAIVYADKIIKKIDYRIYISIVLMFVSLVIVFFINENNKYLFIFIAMFNGSSTGIFLSNVKAYLINKSPDMKKRVIMMCSLVENSMFFLISLIFINILSFYGRSVWLATIVLFIIIWFLYLIKVEKKYKH